MIIIALAQIQLSFNIGALQVSIGGIVEDFKTAPTSVSTALVVYSLAVASFVMLGAKLDKIIGSRTMFQAGVVVHGIAMGMMALSTTASRMIQVQGLARLVAALMVPSLVVLIATHYVLVSASPKSLAGDVGALRGTANNLSTALGTAIVGALAVGVLGALIAGMATAHPDIPPALLRQVNLDNVEFVSNEQLDEILAATTATPEQVAAAIAINEEARLRALKASFLVLAGIAALAIIPAGGLPGYKPEEISVEASDEAVAGSGKSRPHPARARCGAPDAGHQRPVERLERPRAEDDHPGEGGRQAQFAPGGQPEPAQGLRTAQGADRGARAADGARGGAPADHGRAGADPLRPARDAGGGAGLRARLGRHADLRPRRRQHPDRGRYCQADADPGGDDGLRAR
jgi:hypothetical protein